MARFSHESLNLPKPIVGWIYNHASENYWRVANWCEFDDLIQDGLMLAYKCRDRYGRPGKDIDQPHFMALVKKAFYNHIAEILRHSRAEQDNVTRLGDVAQQLEGGSEIEALDLTAPPVGPEQELVAIITRLPETLRKAVLAHLTKSEEFRNNRPRRFEPETEAQVLKRLAGFPLRFDFEQELRDAISSS